MLRYIKQFSQALRVIVFVGLISIFACGCSKHDFNPDDYYTSLLTGDYGKGKFWNLIVTVNGDTVQSDGFVRFESKYLSDADLRFVDVIPGEKTKEFKNVSLTDSDTGLSFTIDYPRKSGNVHIVGSVTLGEMTLDMTLSE